MMSPPAPELPVVPPIAIATPLGLRPTRPSPIVAQAESDPELAIQTGIRVDLPSELRDQLVRKATEAVRTRLLSRAPSHLFEEIRRAVDVAAASVNRDMSKVYDLSEANRLVPSLEKKGLLNEEALRGFAQRRKYEETVAALARLSKSRIEVVRPLMQSLRDDGVLVPCKVAQLGWETVSAILQCRYAGGSMSPLELTNAQEQFAGMNLEKARQLLRHWHVRISSL
jgi:hypothetical protein